MSRLLLSCLLFCSIVSSVHAADAAVEDKPIEAVTSAGDKVILHPSGRWEFVEASKAAAAQEVAKKYPTHQGCPPGWQGGLLGIGRCIPPDDPAFVRGSRGGK